MAPDESYIEADGVFTLDTEGGYAGENNIVRRGERTTKDGSCGKDGREREETRASILGFFAIPKCITGFEELRGRCCFQFASHLSGKSRELDELALLASTHIHDDFNDSIAFWQCDSTTDRRAATVGGDWHVLILVEQSYCDIAGLFDICTART